MKVFKEIANIDWSTRCITKLDKAKEAAAQLDYPVSQVNKNWKIKVTGKNYAGPSINKFVGVQGLTTLLGKHLAYKFINKAMESDQDKVECKLDRGLKIIFYAQ